MSSDSTKPGYVPVAPADVTDERLVAGQLRALQNEVRSGFELLATKLLTAIERLGQQHEDLEDRVASVERDVDSIFDGQDRLVLRVTALEAATVKRRRPAPRK